jgi:apolipoprotein N-acyltransferase
MVNKIKPIYWLFIGIALMFATHLSFSIDIVAWFSSVPFLIYLSVTKGWKSRLLFALTLVIAWSFVVAKILSPPMPFLMVFMFSVPLAFIQIPAYLVWDKFKTYKGAIFLFPSILVVMEWLQYTFTPFASWGVGAYTQSHNLTLIQSVSLFGMAGLSFLIYWINISITEIAVKRKISLLTFQLPLAVLFIFIIFGALRYDIAKSIGRTTIAIAAVGTDSNVSGLPLPSKESCEKVNTALFERTRLAAKSGVKLVVWNEAATIVMPEAEAVWRDSLTTLAAKQRISLVASYIVPVSKTPLKYENKYLFINSNGAVVYSYQKHQPVPGEPSIKGTEPLKIVTVGNTKIGGAICYDYDFPYLAKGFSQLDADIVVVPSSDWREIDPIHTKMAAFRAIEQGHSIVRSTRFGLSAAITPYGEMIAQMSSFDRNNKIMIAHLPSRRVTTVYSMIGDSFIYLCIGLIIVVLSMILRSKKISLKD